MPGELCVWGRVFYMGGICVYQESCVYEGELCV